MCMASPSFCKLLQFLSNTISCCCTMTITKILPLGDQALLAYCDDERTAQALAAQVRQAQWPWLVDVVQAYASVGVYFDLMHTSYTEVAASVRQLPMQDAPDPTAAGNLPAI